jgi:Skp family chaperone for outer membrane proteins
MSRNILIVAVVALVLGAIALVLQFALPGETGVNEARVKALEGRITTLEQKSSAPLKIGYLDAESAFTVFTDAVKDLRQKAQEKASEIVQLQQKYLANAVSKEEFQNKNNQLQVELLQAQLTIDLGTIDKMIAAPGFSDIRSQLERIREEAQPIVDEMKNLATTARVGVLNAQEFQNRYDQVKTAFGQLDQLLTQAALVKIEQATQKVAVQNGYDLVLQKKNVMVYQNTARLTDITDLVKRELASYL